MLADAYDLGAVADPDTVIEGTEDYDGDGRADVFFHNATTGANVIWRGGQWNNRQSMPSVRDLEWSVQP